MPRKQRSETSKAARNIKKPEVPEAPKEAQQFDFLATERL